MSKKISNLKQIETLKHDDASRKNIPTAEYQSVMQFRRMGETHRCSAAAKANDGFHPSYCS